MLKKLKFVLSTFSSFKQAQRNKQKLFLVIKAMMISGYSGLGC